jgi:hypothetical protein
MPSIVLSNTHYLHTAPSAVTSLSVHPSEALVAVGRQDRLQLLSFNTSSKPFFT